VIKTKSSSWTG